MSKKNRGNVNENVTGNSAAALSSVGDVTPTANSGRKAALLAAHISQERTRGGFSAERHPWSSWLGGSEWLLVEGDDYHAKTCYMPFRIQRHAKRRFLVALLDYCKIVTDSDGSEKLVSVPLGTHGKPSATCIKIIKTRPMTDDERAKEEQRRADYIARHGEEEANSDADADLTDEQIAELQATT